jgi:hypothetical protein
MRFSMFRPKTTFLFEAFFSEKSQLPLCSICPQPLPRPLAKFMARNFFNFLFARKTFSFALFSIWKQYPTIYSFQSLLNFKGARIRQNGRITASRLVLPDCTKFRHLGKKLLRSYLNKRTELWYLHVKSSTIVPRIIIIPSWTSSSMYKNTMLGGLRNILVVSRSVCIWSDWCHSNVSLSKNCCYF